MNVYKADIKRSLNSWGFIAGIIGFAIASFFGAFDQILPVFQGQAQDGLSSGYTVQLVISSLQTETLLLVLPILAVLPCTAAFIDEHKSRFLREYLPRAGKKCYIVSKVCTTLLTGGLVLFIGAILICVVFCLLFSPFELAQQLPEKTAATEIINDTVDVSAQLNFIDFISRAFLFFLSGAFWSLIGGLFAAITMSRYMAYAFPFILFYVLIILSERYFKGFYILNPKEWLNTTGDWVGGVLGVALFLIELIVIMSFLYAFVIDRRLRDV